MDQFLQLIKANPLLLALTMVVTGVVGLGWVFMFLDCLIRNFEHSGHITHRPKLDKFIWAMIVLTLIGAPVYYFMVRRKSPHI